LTRAERLCLGIESTAHTFGVSVVGSDGVILSDEKDVYQPPIGSGIHPREAAQHHSEVAARVVEAALRKAETDLKGIHVIGFSKGPGLGPCLRTGATVARVLAAYLKLPLVPVHHAIGHIELAALQTGLSDPLVTLVSGGHTCITAFAEGRWRIYGETEDITLGNLLDGFARKAGLPAPGGAAVERLAREGGRYLPLPYTQKGNDVSYSGLLTAAIRRLRDGDPIGDLCFSLQEVAFAALAEATERALAHTGRRELLLAGGVAANRRLVDMLRQVGEEHDAVFRAVPEEYSGDCGAQIAWTALLAYSKGVRVEVERSFVQPRWRLNRVPVPWR